MDDNNHHCFMAICKCMRSALTPLVGWQEGPVKNLGVGCWHDCLEQDADLHMAQLMPLPLTFSCFSKIQVGFTFVKPLEPAHLGSPGQRAIKRVCVCV